jgi:hypothetical protein
MTSTTSTTPTTPTTAPIHEAYVDRLRARLAKKDITLHEARDGVLDCFVSTYFEGLNHGLQGMLGIRAEPDEVARVAQGIFRRRLRDHGVTFEQPTVAALQAVKLQVDEELHFATLPAEMQATHDQVCSVLLGRAPSTPPAEPVPQPQHTQLLAGPGIRVATPSPPASHTSVTPNPHRGPRPVDELRAVITNYLRDCGQAAVHEDAATLRIRLSKADKLLDALEALS